MTTPETLAHAIRILSIDAVEAAQSGHPGMPLGMADIATVLWQTYLKHNPKNPNWFNRDRFVLSNGHGSMLLYALLHLSGYDLSLNDLKSFRQLHSKTPGHPEHNLTPGVETTTGPLGQGLANAVGMAIAEKILASTFNQPALNLVDHYTYAFVGDGCLMEGISHEVCSFAGTLGLGKLIVFYDDNGISIDGPVEPWFSDNTPERFRSYHWQVIGPIDGHDQRAIKAAIETARAEQDKPSFIICKTIIGFSSLQAGSEKSHGSPLGKTSIEKVREILQWPYDPFVIPDDIYATWNHEQQGKQDEMAWNDISEKYKAEYPDLYQDFTRRIEHSLPALWKKHADTFIQACFQSEHQAEATRKSSQTCLETFNTILPELLGGSADLAGSNNTLGINSRPIDKTHFEGNYLYYGVREFGMAAMMNGMALHGGFIPYGGTFLVFSDYARNAIRLSALMKQRVIYILTHDSIGLGEDGPTHQPIEHAAMLRMTPNLKVWRPADLLETAVAWREAVESQQAPSALLLSRQALPRLPHTSETLHAIQKGAYILKETCPGKIPQMILIATGSEVKLALSAANILEKEGKSIRVVSMPCCERFLEQPIAYQDAILPPTVRVRIAIEAASSTYWYRFVGIDGHVIGLDEFGVSAPAAEAFTYFRMTTEHIIAVGHRLFDLHFKRNLENMHGN